MRHKKAENNFRVADTERSTFLFTLLLPVFVLELFISPGCMHPRTRLSKGHALDGTEHYAPCITLLLPASCDSGYLPS